MTTGLGIFQIRASSSPVLGHCLGCLKHFQAPLPPDQQRDASFCFCYTLYRNSGVFLVCFFFNFFQKPLDLFWLPAFRCCSSFILKGNKWCNPCYSLGTFQSVVNKRIGHFRRNRESCMLPCQQCVVQQAWRRFGWSQGSFWHQDFTLEFLRPPTHRC